MVPNSPIVFVVDDDPSIRSSVARLLNTCGYRVETYASAKFILAHRVCDVPCCLILDVMLPDQDGIGFFEQLTHSGVHLPTIFITGGGDIPMSVRAIKAGAVDFLPKPFDPDQLLDCVANALRRSALALAQEHRLADARANYNTLTGREREVFASVASGQLNKQIAMEYGISEKTIKVHRGRVMEKMHAVSFAELIRLADLLQLSAATPDADESAALARVRIGSFQTSSDDNSDVEPKSARRALAGAAGARAHGPRSAVRSTNLAGMCQVTGGG